MDDNLKKIVDRHIGVGLKKMEEWEEPSQHIINTHKRSMRFMAKDLIEELSGNTALPTCMGKYEADNFNCDVCNLRKQCLEVVNDA